MGAEPVPIPFEELLEHAGWVRALARRLVRDSGVADDLVQETWLAALRRPPADRRNLRGWLGRVVTHAARKTGRRDPPHALAGEAAGATEPPEDLAEALETEQSLVRLVLELEEPYRATVILRYWHDLDSGAIARRLGVPAGTVRWRLSEGLERLRARLDATHGGDRRAWCLALAPLASLARRGGAVSTGAAALPLLGKGLLGMPLALKLSATATLLVLGLLGLRALREESPGRDARATPTIAMEPVAGSRARAPVSTADRRPAEVTEAGSPDPRPLERLGSPTQVRLRARLLDTAGRPLAGATAELSRPYTAKATSGVDGEVTIDLQLRHGAASLELVCLGPTHAQRAVELVGRPGEEVDLGDVVLQPGGTVSGLVLGPDGQPLEDATLQYCAGPPPVGDLDRARREHTANGGHWLAPRTDAEGRFTLRGVPVGEGHAWADREGLLATPSDGFAVEAGAEVSGIAITLATLPREDVIAGIVLDGEGNPVPFAPIQFDYRGWFSTWSHATVSDRQGRFEELCEGTAARRVRAIDPDGRRADAVVEDVRPGTAALELRLLPPTALPVVVVDQTGQRVDSPLLACFLADRDQHIGPREPLVSDPDGALLLPVPGLSFRLVVSAPGHEERSLGPFDPDRMPERLEVVLQTLPGLRGRVRAGGEPVARSVVEVVFEAHEWVLKDGFPARIRPDPTYHGSSDDQGNFAVTVREAGSVFVRVEAPDLAPRELGPLAFDPRLGLDVGTVELDEGGAIEGRVLAPDGANPAGRIVGVSRGDGHAVTRRVGADGRFRFEHLTPGPWQVELREHELDPAGSSWSTDSFRPLAEIPSSCVVVAGQTTVFDLSTGEEPPFVLAGELRVDGQPAAGWVAQLIETLGTRLVPGSRTTACTVDADGHFRLGSPTGGERWLLLRSGDLALMARVRLDAGTRDFRAELATATLDLEGLAPPGEEPAPAALYVWNADDRLAVCPLFSDEQGRIEGLRVLAGSGRVVPYDPVALLADPEAVLALPALLRVELAPGAHERVRVP